MNTWHSQTTSADQGLIIDDETGRNVAVSYDAKDAKLLAAAPELLEFTQTIIRYLGSGGITTKSDKRFVIRMAQDIISKIEE